MHSRPSLFRGHGDTSTSTCDFRKSCRPSSKTVVTQMCQRSTQRNSEDVLQFVTTLQIIWVVVAGSSVVGTRMTRDNKMKRAPHKETKTRFTSCTRRSENHGCSIIAGQLNPYLVFCSFLSFLNSAQVSWHCTFMISDRVQARLL
ncbi:hypothetical protein MPTK1_6g12780 [Marchantia polymorpha subsp. ruderalis]|uniref:Uncharacterized protein n=1 Tax=Marchantia polymorpha subsp. ruderalis TaxID=1480154 RepID=A0AAF6BRE4_MARPO|nr:hypothetical protein Mp_6g12780 [Marchantia polymorpha subsp. ruderalis]